MENNQKYYTPSIEDIRIGYECEVFPDYKIYKDGKVFSIKRNKELKQFKSGKYLQVELWKDKKPYRRYIHRLVAMTYLENSSNLPEVNHIDGDKSNNNDWNLAWTDSSGNIQHAWDTGLKKFSFKNHAKVKLSNEIAEEIRKEYQTGKFTQRDLAKKYNVVVSGINQIIKNKNWKNG